MLLILEITAIVFMASGLGWSVLAQEGGWTTPTVISTPSEISWFPDLAVDPFGTVHVIWCLTTPLGGIRGLQEQVNYTHWGGESWSEPNDIVPPSADIVRNAIATDLSGNVHLLFGGSSYGSLTLYHRRAPLDKAWSAEAWSAPHRINQGISYMGDMAVDSQGVIHVVYDDTIFFEGCSKRCRTAFHLGPFQKKADPLCTGPRRGKDQAQGDFARFRKRPTQRKTPHPKARGYFFPKWKKIGTGKISFPEKNGG